MSPIATTSAGTALADHLRDSHGGDDDPAIRASWTKIAAAMTLDGATHAYHASMDESGDQSYDAMVVVNVATGDLRLLGFIRDP